MCVSEAEPKVHRIFTKSRMRSHLSPLNPNVRSHLISPNRDRTLTQANSDRFLVLPVEAVIAASFISTQEHQLQ
jgi:hypothetical protein